MEQLTAEREVREDAVVVRFEGELDLAVRAAFASQLQHGLNAATGRPIRPLIIDLRGVTFFGSCAIADMLQCHDAGANHGITITLVATDHVRRMINLTGLDEIVGVHPTLDDALGEVSTEASNTADPPAVGRPR
jgi:anti-sigma B factor antagonist